jgi:DNA-directed RNA polymerase subunit M/transcription elongation factor TFIIS
MVQICPECDRVMTRDTSTGSVVFHCHCGIRVEGAATDALIDGDTLDAGETVDMYRRLIRSAAHDRVNQQVRRDCPECGLDYMTQIRVGEQEVVVWKCKCGYEITARDALRR